MFVERLKLDNFRNYRFEELDFAPGLNLISGRNAQGKTNILEAVYYLAAGASFRARRDTEMIRWEQERAAIEASVRLCDRSIVLRAEFAARARRTLYVGGVKEKTASGFAGRLKAVLFAPGDLALVDDGAAMRRRFMDECFAQLRPRYAAATARYNRLHEHKTRILRDHQHNAAMMASLDAFNEQIAAEGAVLIGYRARFCERINHFAQALHGDISGGSERLEARYCTVSTVSDAFAPLSTLQGQILEHMRTHRAAEVARCQALSGPHKDDLDICINGREARLYASQGQKRTAALSLKLAGRELLCEAAGEQPVLLLDDVLSELDERRRDWVLAHGVGGQVIITMCDGSVGMGGGRVSVVEDGTVKMG